MVESNFKWKNDWSKASELLTKLTDVVMARDRYHALRKFDKEYDKYTEYTIVSNDTDSYDQMFAKVINRLIEGYVRDEES